MKKGKLGRVIGIRFPEGHPIWGFPARRRANMVRELVDQALLNQYKLLNDAISRIEVRLGALEAGSVVSTKQETPPKVTIDPAAFFDI